MTNEAQQIVAWLAEMGDTVATNWPFVRLALAAGIAFYLLGALYGRFRDDADPSIRYQGETAAGYVSFLISGVAVTAIALGALAFVLWPLPVTNPFVGASMLGVLGTHYFLEKREVGGN